jgi:UDP-N-acetylglucosamine 2-epimerase (non-hydrolysing)
MPEEINRVVTDTVASLLWTPSPDADENLRNEGIPEERIERVGNIMINSYELLRGQIDVDTTRQRLCLEPQNYAVITLHRPSNVDDPETLALLVHQMCAVARKIPVLFTAHPRTRKRLDAFNLTNRLIGAPNLTLTDPLGYIQFMNLVREAKLVITDSGGIQEETTYLGIPCLTLWNTTERPITITQGTNRLVKPSSLLEAVEAVLSDDWPTGKCPELWDGHTANRVVQNLERQLNASSTGG